MKHSNTFQNSDLYSAAGENQFNAIFGTRQYLR